MTKNTIVLTMLVTCIVCLWEAPAQTSDTRDKIQGPVENAIQTRRKTQAEAAAWRLEKEKLITRFEQLQQEQHRLKQQQTQLNQKITATRQRLTAKRKQLSDIEQISTHIQPFLEKLLASLQARIAADLPFLPAERQQRIKKLDTLMNDPDVDLSERYRKLMEALLVEAEYGFTIETYQETIAVDGQTVLANIFRLGRIGLYYQSLDYKQVGFYNVAIEKWEALPPSHSPAIRTAIDIAAKRRPVELISLPIGKMVIQ